MLIIPGGDEHLTRLNAEAEIQLMLIEPESSKHTGEIRIDQSIRKSGWICLRGYEGLLEIQPYAK